MLPSVRIFIPLLACIVVLLWACNKTANAPAQNTGALTLPQSTSPQDSTITDTIDIGHYQWAVYSLKADVKSFEEKAVRKYILKFAPDKQSFTLNLDINTCFGGCLFGSEQSIAFGALGCTKACCDTEFAQRLSMLIPTMTRYQTSADWLLLSGTTGQILLKKVN